MTLYYHLTTFGCQMNEHDSERIRGVLEEHGWQPADVPEEADLLVFNTCSVRESADSRLRGRLGEAKRLKAKNPERLVALGGCFAQANKEQLFHDLSFLDVAFGPQNIAELPVLLERAAAGPAPAFSFEDNPAPSADLPSRRVDPYHAWIQAMTGCTNYCSYCIVPHVRGPERSRPPDDIVSEVRGMVADGVVEITILGQNVNAYGLDRGDGAADFSSLLAMLDDIRGLRRIRFTTSHPADLSERLIEAIRDLPSVCEHLHLPAQSGADRILERMNRGYTRVSYLGLIDRLRQAVPEIALTTDLIVGFPGEREEDFHHTVTLVRQCRFDGAFTFRYSKRPGTAAVELPGRIPEGTVIRRMNELVDAVQEVAAANNRRLEGKTVEVLIEGSSRRGGGQLRGRTRTNKIVNFTTGRMTMPAGKGLKRGGASAVPGKLVMVRIDSSTSTALKGHLT